MNDQMSSTSTSTAADDQQRARRLPPDLLARTNKDLDELCQLRAKQAEAKQRGQHAGSARAARVQRAILAMAQDRALQLSNWTGTDHARAIWLQGQIKAAIKDHNGMWQQLRKPPHWTTIDKVINSLHDVSK